jgi:hypothetical protein
LPTLASQAEKVGMFRRFCKCQEPRLIISSDRDIGMEQFLKSWFCMAVSSCYNMMIFG